MHCTIQVMGISLSDSPIFGFWGAFGSFGWQVKVQAGIETLLLQREQFTAIQGQLYHDHRHTHSDITIILELFLH